MLRTVMLPVYFDEDNDLILAFARGLTALGVRRVVLAHVCETSGAEGPVVAACVDNARGQMAAFASNLEDAGLACEVRVATGGAAEQLTALASEAQVDAIVYGTHAKSLVDQIFTGSVSERLLREATVPHLVVRFDLLRNAEDPAMLLKHFGEKIILPTDFSLNAAHAFNMALELPASVARQIFLLHAIDPALTSDKLRRAEEGAEFHLKNLQAMCAQQGLKSSVTIVKDASAGKAVLAEIDERRATGVIVGTRGRNAVQELLLGSVSMTLLRQASCPVLIVP